MMIGETTALTLLALAVTACGIAMLHAAWRLKARSWPRIIVAWSCVTGSLVLWSFTSAADKGVAIGIVAWVIIAVLFLAVLAVRSTPRVEKPLRERVAPRAQAVRPAYSRRLYTGLLIGPVAGLIALSISTAAFVGLAAANVEHTLNLTLVSFAFPLLWAGLAVVAAYQIPLWRKTVMLFGIGLLALVFLGLSSWPLHLGV